MASFVYNISLGRAVEFYQRVDLGDPSTALLVVTAINTSAGDATLKDLDTFQQIIDRVDTNEVTNTGYTRKSFNAAGLAATNPDDVSDVWELDVGDITWAAVQAGTSWTDLIFNYNQQGNNVAANFTPMTQHDFNITPDGSDITAVVNVFFRAS